MNIKIGLVSIMLFLGIPFFSFSQCEVLVWSDEFNGTGLPNSANWTYDLGNGCPNLCGWGNQEVQNYTNSTTNVRQENGSLIIDALKSGSNWTSARVKSQGRQTFKYGKIVFRAKMPTGVGTWAANWMLGSNITSVGWPDCGEIDVLEHIGRRQNAILAAIHTRASFGDTQTKGETFLSTASTDFNEYAVSWNSERIIFYVNDVPYYTYNPAVKNAQNWPFNAEQFIIMNIAMGGTLGGPIDPNLTAARMEIDWVRVYEERTEPVISGPKFLFENQQNVAFQAPDYGANVTYTWSAPDGANIVSGQGTREIVVNWGDQDGTLNLSLSGETGCSVNTTAIEVTTILEPTGSKFTVQDFSSNSLVGWSKNDDGISFQTSNNKLVVSYNVSGLKFAQYDLPKAVDLSEYGILKIPIRVPASSAIPDLLITLRDGDGRETITTNYEVEIQKNDGNTYIYAYNFDGQWALNNPDVNANFIKQLRIYMIAGTGTFEVGNIEMYNSEVVPTAPTNFSVSETDEGDVSFQWVDNTSATSFNLYKSTTANGEYTRVESGIKTFEVPYVIPPSIPLFYKITGVNKVGESPLSSEVFSSITSSELSTTPSFFSYPNPSTGKFYIQTNGNEIDNLGVFDLQGRSQAFTLTREASLLEVNMKSASSGIYFVFLYQKEKQVVMRMMIN